MHADGWNIRELLRCRADHCGSLGSFFSRLSSLDRSADRPERLNAKQSTSLHTKRFLQYLELWASEQARTVRISLSDAHQPAAQEIRWKKHRWLLYGRFTFVTESTCLKLSRRLHSFPARCTLTHTRGRRLFRLIFALRRLETLVMILLTAGSHEM
jgi:hypothetical protein